MSLYALADCLAKRYWRGIADMNSNFSAVKCRVGFYKDIADIAIGERLNNGAGRFHSVLPI
jgi:hypothetical protein